MKQCAVMSGPMVDLGGLWSGATNRLRSVMLVAALSVAAAPAMAVPVEEAPVEYAAPDASQGSSSRMVAIISQPASTGRRPAPALMVAAAPVVDFTEIYSRAPSPKPEAPAPQYAPDTHFHFETPGKARNPLAAIRSFSATGASDYDRALDCMTMAIAYEAGLQPQAGMEAVGQVILNRMRSVSFPKSVCGVVFQGSERRTGCQFTFTCDGSLRRILAESTLARSRIAASTVLASATADHVAGATHYHADYVLPYWAATGTRVAKIGAHIFYRMQGDSSTSANAGMLANEPQIAMARLAAGSPTVPRGIFAPWGLASEMALNRPAKSPTGGLNAP